MQLEQRPVTLAVGAHGADHDDDQVDGERSPAHQEGPEQDGERQRPPHVVAPPPALSTPPPAAAGKGRNPSGVDACQHEHVDVEEADNPQGDNEEDNEADHDDVGVEEAHHEHGRHPTRRPNHTQNGSGAPHSHDDVVPKRVEDGDVTESKNMKFNYLLQVLTNSICST